jgi:hypothetical protein
MRLAILCRGRTGVWAGARRRSRGVGVSCLEPRNAHFHAAMSVHWTNVGELLESRAANDHRIVAADCGNGSLRAP